MMDETVLRNIEKQSSKVINKDVRYRGNGCLLFVEFAGDNLVDVEQKFADCKGKLSSMSTIIESVSDENSGTNMGSEKKCTK